MELKLYYPTKLLKCSHFNAMASIVQLYNMAYSQTPNSSRKIKEKRKWKMEKERLTTIRKAKKEKENRNLRARARKLQLKWKQTSNALHCNEQCNTTTVLKQQQQA